ncbi:hypothetical protein LZD49_32375 [Dyadobacter sp. CY261]|uniref:zincin-like metallopeptidase domain-containing protein n=1 Tax=Dyadobacter sp. CY261 TaxID=2907203 RepID=UPI001EEA414F|nr:zincin-like metallopeptidase domain-containing protein [Dyadobacter sp. CY261]MCF0075224.1 hypothetical protein [Dyadobacter sp. CY261]
MSTPREACEVGATTVTERRTGGRTGACFLGVTLDFEPMPEEQHAAYIQSWLKVLKDDKRFIFSAASHAQKAVEFLFAPQ